MAMWDTRDGHYAKRIFIVLMSQMTIVILVRVFRRPPSRLMYVP